MDSESLRKKISFFTEEIYFENNNEVLIFYRGNEKAIREYINVLDAAYASVKVLNKTYKNKCVILTGQKTLKIKEFLKFLGKTLNISSKIIFRNEKNSKHYIKTPSPYQMKKGKKFKFNKTIDFKKGINSLILELKNIN